MPANDDPHFRDAVQGHRRGDFWQLEPLFERQVVEWHRLGFFSGEPAALAEAFSCACFLGKTDVAEYLLGQGVDPLAGNETGLNGFHWAADRRQLKTVEMLINRGVPLEIRNMYGGTVLGTTIWSASDKPRTEHLAIIEALIRAGASLEEAGFPTGNEAVDEVLRRNGPA